MFTTTIDAYSHGMTYYEILTRKLLFNGHPINDYYLALKGRSLEVLECVDGWVCQSLRTCWESNRIERATFKEIWDLILASSTKNRRYGEEFFF